MSGQGGGPDYETIMATLQSMGYSEQHINHALVTSGKADLNSLIEWISTHPNPYSEEEEKKKAKEAETKFLSDLTDMGFTKAHVQAALKAIKTPNQNLSTLVNWLSSNPEPSLPQPKQGQGQGQNSNGNKPGTGETKKPNPNEGSGNSNNHHNNTGGADQKGSKDGTQNGASPNPGTQPKVIDLTVDNKHKDPKDNKTEDLPGSTSLQRQTSRELFKAILIEQKKAGVRLDTGQINFLLKDDYKHGAKFKCVVCFEDGFELDKIFVLEKCKHFLCGLCMSEYIVTAVKSNEAAFLHCPIFQCKEPIDQSEVSRAVPKEEYQRYLSFLLDDNLKKDPTCRWCPKPGCGTAMIGNPQQPMMRCPNTECKFAFCFNCKEAWHSDTTCEEYQKWKEENGDADNRFREWAKKNTKGCPKCKVLIQKNAGCNHMKCPSCKNEFCWLCNQCLLVGGKYKEGHWALFPDSPCYEKMHS